MSYPQTTFRHVEFRPNGFWAKKRRAISLTGLLYQLDVLKSTGRYDAFALKWHSIYDDPPEIWPVPKHLFWDSDVAKWIEAACYFLHGEDNEAVRTSVEELVQMIRKAQEPDGYLNIHFTLVAPGKRFSNLRDLHELYNAGHLIEAALAHEQLTGNRDLLEPIVKYVSLIYDTFGPGPNQKPGYPGHPEIELALLRLYDRTQDPRHLQLAEFFLSERGNPNGIDGMHYYDYEARKRGEGEHEIPDYFPERRSYWYQQAHKPILQQETIEGHAVRAMYLLTALADLVRMRGPDLDEVYGDSLRRLWANMVEKKMYVTGGIGATKQWEGFGQNYFLPQSTDEGGCYAETCAAIGIMMLADRLLELELDGQYGDIMELALYNAVLTGVSCDGKRWTYTNQLASSDADLSTRSEWFTVACCPPNVLRLLGGIGGYLYSSSVSESKTAVNIHLFADADIKIETEKGPVHVSMKTAWPMDGEVLFELKRPTDLDVDFNIRIPGWAGDSWLLEPSLDGVGVQKGYLRLNSKILKPEVAFTLKVEMVPFFVTPHPHAGQSTVAVQRGPIVYCVEDCDNEWVQDHFKNVTIDQPKSVKLLEAQIKDLAYGEEYVSVTAFSAATELALDVAARVGPGYRFANGIAEPAGHSRRDLNFIPYYFRANRPGRGHMRTCIRAAV